MMILTVPTPAFPLGKLAATPGALQALKETGQCLEAFVIRHACGDWGDLCDADRQENARALREGGRLMSTYTLKNGQTLWIITEADRSVTTLLLPLEY
jgi:hypothetical protein